MIVPLHVLKITTKSNFGAFWPKATWYLSDSAWLQKKMEFFAKLAPSFSYHTISYSWHNLVFQVLSIVSARFECTVWQNQFRWNVISLQNFKELSKNSQEKYGFLRGDTIYLFSSFVINLCMIQVSTYTVLQNQFKWKGISQA